jgi:hypothetical protein
VPSFEFTKVVLHFGDEIDIRVYGKGPKEVELAQLTYHPSEKILEIDDILFEHHLNTPFDDSFVYVMGEVSHFDVAMKFLSDFVEYFGAIYSVRELRLIDAACQVTKKGRLMLTPFLYHNKGTHFYERYGFKLTKESMDTLKEAVGKIPDPATRLEYFFSPGRAPWGWELGLEAVLKRTDETSGIVTPTALLQLQWEFKPGRGKSVKGAKKVLHTKLVT